MRLREAEDTGIAAGQDRSMCHGLVLIIKFTLTSKLTRDNRKVVFFLALGDGECYFSLFFCSIILAFLPLFTFTNTLSYSFLDLQESPLEVA